MKNNNLKPAEIIQVADDVDEVVCDGGIGPLGHPQVWYRLGKNNSMSCHYCGRKFVKNTAG